jgi:cell division cycle 20-like protein 1 (cofactor of APC complex)
MKVLDAPELRDCFCLNLIDWSSRNVLCAGLGSCAYLWSACIAQARMLFDLSNESNSITSVAWNERVSHNSISLFLYRAVNSINLFDNFFTLVTGSIA